MQRTSTITLSRVGTDGAVRNIAFKVSASDMLPDSHVGLVAGSRAYIVEARGRTWVPIAENARLSVEATARAWVAQAPSA